MIESSVCDATIVSSIMFLEASFMLIYDVYGAGVTYDDHQMTIKIGLLYRPQLIFEASVTKKKVL